jgi:hypothetical protein
MMDVPKEQRPIFSLFYSSKITLNHLPLPDPRDFKKLNSFYKISYFFYKEIHNFLELEYVSLSAEILKAYVTVFILAFLGYIDDKSVNL